MEKNEVYKNKCGFYKHYEQPFSITGAIGLSPNFQPAFHSLHPIAISL